MKIHSSFDLPFTELDTVDEGFGARSSVRLARSETTETPPRQIDFSALYGLTRARAGDMRVVDGRVYRFGDDGVWHDLAAPELVKPKRLPGPYDRPRWREV